MAFRNGTPTVWIAHDWRTLELVRALKLPFLMLDDVLKIHDIDEIKEKADYSETKKYYRRLKKNYGEFIKNNTGLEIMNENKSYSTVP